MQHASCPIAFSLALVAGIPAQGVHWHPVPAAAGQPNVVHAAMASDPLRQRIVLFGADAVTMAPTTWEWDGATWQVMAPATQPPVRNQAAMAFDPVRGRILFTGGKATAPPFTWLNDAWEWDGVAWQQLPAVANRPTALVHQIATDLGHSRLLFVDAIGSIRTWNGATWQILASVPLYPITLFLSSAVAWDEARGKLVCQFYGYEVQYNPPWYVPTNVPHWYLFEWDGSLSPVSSLPGGVPLQWASPMFFDAGRQRVGVLDLPNLVSPVSTWEWSGSWYLAGQHALTWEPLVANDHAHGTTMAYDAAPAPAQATRIFRLASLTPATVVSYGSGCAGSAGVPVLANVAYELPWIGDTVRNRVNVAPGQLGALFASSLAQLPLPISLAAVGMPGCNLLLPLDVVDFRPTVAGVAVWSFAIPNSVSFVGVPIYQQAFPLDAAANPLGLVASNGLVMTLGIR